MTYEYTREKLTSGSHTGAWDIDNPDRVDGEGQQIYLSNEIQSVLPDKHFTVNCNSGVCSIDFNGTTLTSEEKSTLDVTVANHKSNT